jgi:hypothetical protein
MSSVIDLYNENLRRQGLADAATVDLVDVPARRTVASAPVPVAVKTSAPSVPAPKPIVVGDDRVTDLERRITALENLLRPALGKKPISELEQIELDYIALGATELTFHQFRTLPRVKRKALLAGVQ